MYAFFDFVFLTSLFLLYEQQQQTERALSVVLKRSGQKALLITLQGGGGGGRLQHRGQLHTAGLQGNTSDSSARVPYPQRREKL
ncbi:hypothetical protein PBY51_007308 [Eleginops maclovinus]|uniref:Secreted protein n=1 Tax=Eleginops maclovinus TaxID=56733 RepID=A0AAN7X501_ELEMC|nr:hypothetical protein PBY51_007308 [Eleginops maclovinus]